MSAINNVQFIHTVNVTGDELRFIKVGSRIRAIKVDAIELKGNYVRVVWENGTRCIPLSNVVSFDEVPK